jgi:hypothetical protein
LRTDEVIKKIRDLEANRAIASNLVSDLYKNIILNRTEKASGGRLNFGRDYAIELQIVLYALDGEYLFDEVEQAILVLGNEAARRVL